MTDGYKINKVRIRQNGVEKIVRPSVPATAISLDKSSISLKTAGQTSQITATLTPADSTSTVSWTSSNTSIATVSSTGLVTCVTPGNCTITATTSNGLTATCSVKNSWAPGANTVAYYPLTSTSTVNDMSGNNHNLTNQNVTFGTYQGVNCGYFNARGSSTGYCGLVNYSFHPRVSSSLPLTVNVWFYASGNTTYNNPRIAEPIVWAKDYGNKIIAGWYNNGNINGAPFNIGKWTNVCFILTDSNHYTVYKNGVQQYANVYTASLVSNSRYFTMGTRSDNGTQYGDKWDGGISNFILENKARTAQEISDYYNLTKSTYGL